MTEIAALVGCVGACVYACVCVYALPSLKYFRSNFPALTWLCDIYARPTENIPTHTHWHKQQCRQMWQMWYGWVRVYVIFVRPYACILFMEMCGC